jgi:broad specificity phosphatase PhoE
MDVSLNDKGKRQAGALHRRLKGHLVEKVYSSNKKRAVQTARIIFPKAKIERVPGLEEMDFGIFEGMTHCQILEKYPRIYQKWLNDPFSVRIPKGESLNSFKKRVIAAFEKLVCGDPGNFAVVCHGGTISMYLNHIRGKKDFWGTIPRSTALSIIEYKGNKVKIKLQNDTSHLDF